MNRKNQYYEYNYMIVHLLCYARVNGIPLRMGEAQRTKYQALENVRKGKGILNSKHRWSLAQDFWIIKPYKGKVGRGIVWWDKAEKKITPKQIAQYKALGKCWKDMGGIWGALKKDGGDFNTLHDPYHFEFAEKPA